MLFFQVPFDVYISIKDKLSARLVQKRDAVGDAGADAWIKILIGLHKLRTANPSVQYVTLTYFRTSTVQLYFNQFIDAAFDILVSEYLPGIFSEGMNAARSGELSYNESIGWPGCCGNIDGTFIPWGKCPKSEQGKFKGRKGTGIIVHAVAFHTLLCGHLYVGEPASKNDIQVLQRDPIFKEIFDGRFCADIELPEGNLNHIYLRGDGIYPSIPVILKPIRTEYQSTNAKARLYNDTHEGSRKSVERLFGVVQGR